MQSISTLYNDVAERLELTWCAGKDGAFRILAKSRVASADLVGHLNLIHSARIQIIGKAELVYFDWLTPERRFEYLNDFLVYGEPPAIIVGDSLTPPDFMVSWCNEHAIPLFASPESSADLIDYLRVYFNRQFAEQTTRHGVLMDVLGVGVLIFGESGLGKSELALELISRGHGLVADDAVELLRTAPDYIEGRCPPLLQNLLEVRGIGLLDIKMIFGETAVRRKIKLRLIVQLVRRAELENHYERLPSQALTEEVLGVDIRKVVLPVAAGRNLAVLLEAAVRNTVLQLRGIDTLKDFMERQRQAMEEQSQQSLPLDHTNNQQGNI
ncbi:HPr kinase/phosphorylase [Formosimonas limnophila]|uniref:HPr kinase/phosphorylase n=1 Tax=Formosimonas limnophila TaxID=1384487 RepID=A0A8J3CLA4_9BURK|nr:HPr(Ser) kinase/phosphatase [Formosimonas limnophila]GHA72923.1 HPr kinase/phosphorylase [Formosimonas limnophila]